MRAVWQNEEVVGIAPLMLRGKTASIVGSADVCDYLDFVVAPGRGRDFFAVLLDHLAQRGVEHLELGPLRPESTVLTELAVVARDRECQVLCHEEAVSVEMDLPSTWDGYLAKLDKKQRHELKRKLRRLLQAGDVSYHCVQAGREVGAFMDTFMELFALSHEEKAGFMTDRMASFFRSLAEAMAGIGLLRFGILELDGLTAAMIMGFDYQDTMYLYNSAYDPQYSYLSVGLLSKALCLKESIQRDKKKWDFLKGGEPYKYHLGGREVPLYGCRIEIK